MALPLCRPGEDATFPFFTLTVYYIIIPFKRCQGAKSIIPSTRNADKNNLGQFHQTVLPDGFGSYGIVKLDKLESPAFLKESLAKNFVRAALRLIALPGKLEFIVLAPCVVAKVYAGEFRPAGRPTLPASAK